MVKNNKLLERFVFIKPRNYCYFICSKKKQYKFWVKWLEYKYFMFCNKYEIVTFKTIQFYFKKKFRGGSEPYYRRV